MDGNKGCFTMQAVEKHVDHKSKISEELEHKLDFDHHEQVLIPPFAAMDLRDEKCQDHNMDVHAHTHSESQKFSRILGQESHFNGKIQGPTWACRSHCWLCGEWVPYEFECTPSVSFSDKKGDVSRVYVKGMMRPVRAC